MVAPVTFATLVPPNQNLSLFDDMFSWLSQYAIVPCTCTGTNALTLTTIPQGPVVVALPNSSVVPSGSSAPIFSFTAANTSTGTVTAAIVGIAGTFNVYANPAVQAGSQDIVAGVKYLLGWDPTLNGGAGGFQIMGTSVSVFFEPWATYTPTIAAGSGAITTVAATGQYSKVGKIVQVQGQIVITTNGTGATNLTATLPSTTANVAGQIQTLAASEVTDGYACAASVPGNSQILTITKYDGTYPGANGKTIVFGGTYQSI